MRNSYGASSGNIQPEGSGLGSQR